MTPAEILNQFILNNGPDSYEKDPWKAYQDLLENGCRKDLADALLYSFVSGIPSILRKEPEKPVAEGISRTCFLRKQKALELAEVYESLKQERKNADHLAYAGFQALAGRESFVLHWEGDSEWNCSTGSILCTGTAEITVRVKDPEQLKQKFGAALKDNPYLDENTLKEKLETELSGKLSRDFDYYCTCGPDYEPWPDDYAGNGEEIADDFCKEAGLELLNFDFEGHASEFMPSF